MENSDTIVAISTPHGLGALAVIRISGDDAISLVGKKVIEKERFKKAKPNKVELYKFAESSKKEIIDEITAVKYIAPRSFTGENMVEIICHGGRIVTERILESLVDESARYAGRGEFTRRAFSNGKTDLVKAESINQIVSSSSIIQQKNAIRSYLGGYEPLINKWKNSVEDIMVDIESEIEFGEDDDICNRDVKNIVKQKVEILNRDILSELEKRKIFKELEDVIDIAIIGPANAGKSSIINLILGYDRAIVDAEEGTTRDFITEIKKMGDMQVKFIDTAGLKQTDRRIERLGIERARGFIESSRVIIWVTAANEELRKEEKEIKIDSGRKLLGIINKIDLSEGTEKERLFKQRSIPYKKTIAIDRRERRKIEEFIVKEIKGIYNDFNYDSIIINKRQEKIIEEILGEVGEIKKRINGDEEFISLYCRNILDKLEEFVGKVTTDDILDKIFEEFCVGK